MKTEIDLGYLLRAVKYRDSDLVVSVLTRSHGALGLLARGARKSQKRFGGALDYGRLFTAQFSMPGEKGLGILSSVALAEDFPAVASSIERHAALGHALEVIRLAAKEGDPSPEPFILLDSFLRSLGSGGDILSLLRIFQTKAAALAGYSLSELYCASCGAKIEDAGFCSDGKLHCASCPTPGGLKLSAGALKTLKAASSLPPGSLNSLRIGRAIDAEIGSFLEERLSKALGCSPKSLTNLRSLFAN